jgi:signal transduction histidine kinase/CheY-like chemotaxis protein
VPRAGRIARLVPATGIALVTAHTSVALFGWTSFGVDVFAIQAPNGVSMKPNTAAGLLMAALSFILLATTRRRSIDLIARATGVVVAVLGTLTLFEHASNIDLGIDRWLIPSAAEPARMSIVSAANLVLVGLALVLWDVETRRHRWPTHLLLTITLALSWLIVVTHLIGVREGQYLAWSTDMPIHTAVAFVVLSGALLVARHNRGLLGIVSSQGEAGILARRLLLAAMSAPPVLGWLALQGERAGFYDAAVSTSLIVIGDIAIFVGIVLWNSRVLYEAERERNRAAADLAAAMHVIPVAIGIANDPSCAQLTANPSLETLLRLPPGSGSASHAVRSDESLRHARIYRNGREVPLHEMPMQVAARYDKAVTNWDADVIQDDGGVVSILGSAVPLHDEGGNVRGSVGTFVDITERKRTEAEREMLLRREQQARADAEAASRMKDEFLSVVSHELRTPLNAVLGWARILTQSKLDPERLQRAVGVIERNAATQAALIDDLLDVSRIISGGQVLDMHSVDIAEVVREAIEAVRPAAQAKGIRLELTTSGSRDPVTCDPRRVRQIVWNLVSNAVKFCGGGTGVDVACERTASGVQILVTDTGPGIAPEFLPHIFERFRQADSTTTRTHGGLGLGLAIVRHLTELHGGHVSAESAGPGTGASFRVTLPAHGTATARTLPAPAPKRTESVPAPPIELTGIRALIVEDDADSREVLQLILTQAGATVTAASSVREALAAVANETVDVVVTDLGMPEQDGFSLIAQLRQNVGYASLPVIAVTGYARDEDRARALHSGFQAHVAKPVEAEQLCAAIASVVGVPAGGQVSHGSPLAAPSATQGS